MGESDRRMDALHAALHEHIPGEMVVEWTHEELDRMGLGRPPLEDHPPEVGFRVRQRMILHAADRTTGELSRALREAHAYNAAHGRIVLDDEG